jgi:cytochrome P450
LSDDKEKLKTMDQFFMPFSLGARTCIGKNISLLEINKVVPVLVRDFDIEFVSKDGDPLKGDILPGKNRWFVKPEGLYARLKRRS